MTTNDTHKTARQDSGSGKKTPGRWARTATRIQNAIVNGWEYWSDGIWRDNRSSVWVNVLKTVNISVSSFLNKDLQGQACALTYRTMLAIVPALALLFAIGRGFGFQNLLQDELMSIFPSQEATVETALRFVDSYLNQSSEGMFVGVGLIFLLWTLISLIGNVENTFNMIWGVRQGRSFWRKITDYTAMFLILPVLMICAAGLSIMLSSTLQQFFHMSFMTPVIAILLDIGSWVFTWLFFGGVFALIPNAKVKFKNALLAGVLTGTAFKVLQWLFATGLLYVTRYNAIYGSFSFVPLLLLWIQLTWMSVLCGTLVCYSSQNIFLYAFSTEIGHISVNYRNRVITGVAALIVQRFVAQRPPLTKTDITQPSEIPPRLVSDVLDSLIETGLFVRVAIDIKEEIFGYQPGVDPGILTLGLLRMRLNSMGRNSFIPNFSKRFPGPVKACDEIEEATAKYGDSFLLKDLPIDSSLVQFTPVVSQQKINIDFNQSTQNIN